MFCEESMRKINEKKKMSDSFRDVLWCSVNTYSDRLVSK